MKWFLLALLFPLICVVAVFDTVIWNVTHGFGNKTSIPESVREICALFTR